MLFRSKRYQEADALDKKDKPVPGRQEALLAAGSACVDAKEYDKAMALYENALKDGMEPVSYTHLSPKLERDRNLVFLSDLHNNEFGRDNGELVAAIHRLHPDAVLSCLLYTSP